MSRVEHLEALARQRSQHRQEASILCLQMDAVDEVMKRAQWHRDDALNAHDRADNALKRQFYQGAAEALQVVIRDYDSTVAKTPLSDSGGAS